MCGICACAHTHEEAEEYENDEVYHWIPCVDEDCDFTYNKVAHTWGTGEVTTNPTASNDGVMSYLCTVCKRLKQEPVKYNPNPTVTTQQWQDAFELTKFNNVVATLVESVEYDGIVSKQEYKIYANQELIYLTMTVYENNVEKQYMGKYQDGNYLWSFSDKEQKIEDVEPTISRDVMKPTAILTDNGFDKLKDLYQSFIYNEATGYYEANDVTIEGMFYGYKSVAVKMADGKILEIKATSTHSPSMEIFVAFSNYGGANPTPPSREENK